MTAEIVRVDLLASTAHAVSGTRTVLVDTGPAGAERRLLERLRRAGITPGDVSLIVLTHCHPDHAGGAAALRRLLDVPVAVHAAEVDWATSGSSEFYDPVRPFGHVLRRVLAPTYPAFTPDVVLRHGDALDRYGAPLDVLHTPGHTPGSVSLVHRPDRTALVGDLLAGSMLRTDRPLLPFLAQSTAQIEHSVRTVLAEGVARLLFGHGRAASALSVLHRFGPLAAPSVD